ncbi:MAG: FAD-dependent oxidoreductase [Erythrobacter sp.]|jgi:predicted NAD/FAD-dependent oxidoreductase|nr:FAD-dependent oxidoreductase [Erythrobacter sp.]
MDGQYSDILVIGAGMAGLACASELARSGARVTVIDKGRGPGGRMAARRVEIAGETVSFDHGAQYFTARDAAFRETVAEWEQAGVVARWPAAGEEAWVGVPGMNAPIRAMASALDVRWGVRACTLTRCHDQWFVDAGDEGFTAAIVLVAVPAEQASEILAVTVPDLAAIAASVRSEPCWAVMAAFSERLSPAADTFRSDAAPVSWAARNSAKPGRSGAEGWVIHASPARSRELLDVPREEVAHILLADFFAACRIAPVTPVHLHAHRWLYALPQPLAGEDARFDPALGLGLAGDWLHSPRVEGAFVSGRALAALVLAQAAAGAGQ